MVDSKILFPGFMQGLGHKVHTPGGYGIVTNGITRFGGLMNGLKEEADMSGIAAGYRVVRVIKHNDVNIAITTNGTNSKIYREESNAWVEKETVNSAVCTDVASFHDGSDSLLAWCFGDDVAFRFSSNDGTAWEAATASPWGNARFVKYFLVQQNNLSGARVLIAVDPNRLYFADSLDNSATVSTDAEIGDASSQDYWTSLIQDDLGVVYCGKRHYLYAYANGPSVVLAGPFNDPPADAGGMSDRNNFENPQILPNGVIVYPVEGYDILGVRHSERFPQLSPRWTPRLNGWICPRLELPINAMLVVGDYLIVALGSGNTASNRSVVSAPGGTNLLQNTFATTSELYVAQIVGDSLVWHGSELTCTDLLRYLWFDEDDGYLYLASGAAESANQQQRRCFFFQSAPEITLSSSNLQLNTTDPAILETAVIGADDPFDHQIPLYFKALATGLASSVPSLRVDFRWTGEFDTTTTYSTLETYTNGQRALTGTRFRNPVSSTVGRLRFVLTADSASTPDRFAILRSAELLLGTFAERRLPVGAY